MLACVADVARARQLRQAETWAEKLAWRWLCGRRFTGCKFRRQHPPGDCYLDFFRAEADCLKNARRDWPDQF